MFQRFMGISSGLRQGKQQSLGAWQHFHITAVGCYASFLLDLAERVSVEPLTWSFFKGLADQPDAPQGRTLYGIQS